MKTIPGRKDDPFSKAVLGMMTTIEEKIRQTPGIELSSNRASNQVLLVMFSVCETPYLLNTITGLVDHPN